MPLFTKACEQFALRGGVYSQVIPSPGRGQISALGAPPFAPSANDRFLIRYEEKRPLHIREHFFVRRDLREIFRIGEEGVFSRHAIEPKLRRAVESGLAGGVFGVERVRLHVAPDELARRERFYFRRMSGRASTRETGLESSTGGV